MRLKLKVLRPYLLASLLILLGYVLALCSFKADTLIDLKSGRVRTTYEIFPFTISSDHSGRAFEVLFPTCTEEKADWGFIERKRFTSFFYNVHATTTGTRFVQAESKLVHAFMLEHLPEEARDKMAADFFAAISQSGPEGASEYANEAFKKQLLLKYGDD